MTRSHLFCFYAWHASILMYKVTPKYLGFKYSSILESCWLPFFHTRKGFYVSVTHVHGAKLRHLTFDLWTGLWISSSMEALSHCSPERTNLKSHLKISQESFFSPPSPRRHQHHRGCLPSCWSGRRSCPCPCTRPGASPPTSQGRSACEKNSIIILANKINLYNYFQSVDDHFIKGRYPSQPLIHRWR